jgi:hypothetical protein
MEVMIAVQSGTIFFTNNEQRNYNKQRTPTTTRTPYHAAKMIDANRKMQLLVLRI